VVDAAAHRRTEATPFWFGNTDRPLFGWLHLPGDGQVRGAVALCQPLGLEALCVYFSFRLLADRLAELGIAVLRFDYDGTGDSVGEETDPHRVPAWLSSVTMATDYLAGLGAGPIGLIGIRMGGLLAAHEATGRDDLDLLVLWDPCLSGRAFVREQQFLRTLSGEHGAQADEGVDAPGIRFEPDTVAELSDLALSRLSGTLARRHLVLVPPESTRPKTLERLLGGAEVDWQDATGEVALLDSQRQEPPYDTVERVAAWVVSAWQGPSVAVRPPVASEAVVGSSIDGRPVTEHTVTLGALDLFGIVTEGPHGHDSPTVVLVNEGGTHHIGQARMWVDLARTLAPRGFRVLRFDLSGNGDSGARPGQQAHVARAPEAIDDVAEAVRAISPSDPGDVVLIGFCSGGYQVVEQALATPPKGICVINPTFAFATAEPAGSADRPARQAPKAWFARPAAAAVRRLGRTKSPEQVARWTRAVESGSWTVTVASAYPRVPSRVWWLVYRFLFERNAISTLETVVGSGVDTVLIVGPHDFVPISLGWDRRVEALMETPNFHLVRLDQLEHAAWALEQRHLMISVITEHVVGSFGPERSDRLLIGS
jgi:alpha-beta hydrolase superfamily lysophospholipase